MEVTKVSDRVDALENQSNDDNEETKSVGAVNIEFTPNFSGMASSKNKYCWTFDFLGLSDLILSKRLEDEAPSTVISDPSISQKITKKGFS